MHVIVAGYTCQGDVVDSRLYSYGIAVAQAHKERPKQITEDTE